MPTPAAVIVCAALAALFWSGLGAAVGRRLGFGRTLVWPLAPALGFAVHSAVALPVALVVGFSSASVPGLAAASALASLALAATVSGPAAGERAQCRVPAWAYLGAALVALAPAAAIMPKLTTDGVVLATPIYDHAKIAIIDEIARLGVPPDNPFFGPAGASTRLAYYYLWHFAAAELAVVFGIGGWGADAALTWFSAFASLAAMLGFATWLTGRRAAALWVLLLSLAASLRPVLAALFGADALGTLISDATGFSGWLFQAAWVPQHLASATCAVLAIFLLARMRQHPTASCAAVLALVVAAGFESSTWVGGLTFGLAAPVAGLALLLVRTDPDRRLQFLLASLAAAVLALALVTPLLRDQLLVEAGRSAMPIAIEPYPVLAAAVPQTIRRVLDLPSYWLVLLVIELPAIYLAGAAGLARLLMHDSKKNQPAAASAEPASDRRPAVIAFAALTLVSLTVAWLLASTIGNNNDLGWRAVLPAVTLLTVFAAGGLAQWIAARAIVPAAAALAMLVLALPDGLRLVYGYVAAPLDAADDEFAATAGLWEAVRRHTAPAERVGNNPLYLRDTTAWPINISWALLADRRSCFAGEEWTKVFTTLPLDRRVAITDQFTRVFAGAATPQDVRDLALRYNCRAVVITADDGAWEQDPFAQSPYYRLVESDGDSWRIYRAADADAQAANP